VKKLVARWRRLSRPVRILCLLLTICLMLLIAYVVCDFPPLNTQMAFRQAERGAMIGPANIIAQFHPESTLKAEVIIGESEHTYTLFYCGSKRSNVEIRNYKKTGQMALYHLPGSQADTDGKDVNVPLKLILFDLEPRAQRAELEFDFSFQYDYPYTISFASEAQREYGSFFIFPLYLSDPPAISYAADRYAFRSLAESCSQYNHRDTPSVTVRLYDKNDQLIRTEVIFAGPWVQEDLL